MKYALLIALLPGCTLMRATRAEIRAERAEDEARERLELAAAEDAELQAHAEANPNATLDCVAYGQCASDYLDHEAADRHARGYAVGTGASGASVANTLNLVGETLSKGFGCLGGQCSPPPSIYGRPTVVCNPGVGGSVTCTQW